MRKVALIIFDGWGYNSKHKGNAIFQAHTPFFDRVFHDFPHTILQASHEYVGLDKNALGGSEVGHLTIGAGRVVLQDSPRITSGLVDFQNGKNDSLLASNLQSFLNKAKIQQPHLIGMISPGGIHSRQEHLYQIMEIMKGAGCLQPIIHFISDGRDSLPNSGIGYAKKLLTYICKNDYGKVATLIGRFYAMDRDNNQNRTNEAVDLILNAKADISKSYLLDAFHDNYINKLTDELQKATLIDPDYQGIKDGEPLFFFNFRSDRMKQLVSALHNKIPKNPIFTMTSYSSNFDFPIIFAKNIITHTLGEQISRSGLSQLRVAETDKIPHVTYFFNGGSEKIFAGESRDFVASTKETYDKTPKMKAKEIVDIAVEKIIQKPEISFVLVNFANADLVAHFGNFESTISACEVVDIESSRLCQFLMDKGFICCITSDHGHAEDMIDEQTGQVKTAHTLNPVPFIIYAPNTQNIKLDQNLKNGLSRIAATILDLMGLPSLDIYDPTLIKSN